MDMETKERKTDGREIRLDLSAKQGYYGIVTKDLQRTAGFGNPAVNPSETGCRPLNGGNGDIQKGKDLP